MANRPKVVRRAKPTYLERARKRLKGKDIQELLDEISVLSPGMHDGPDRYLSDWYAVADDEGVVAYFRDEDAALGHRLSIINGILNG